MIRLRSTMTVFGIFASGVAGLLAAILFSAVPMQVTDGSELTTIVVVEELPTLKQGQTIPKDLKEAVAILAPFEPVRWEFAYLDPANVGGMRDLVARRRPKVVILLNETLLQTLGDDALPTSFLVPSELPPELIERRFGDVRKTQRVAFLSWYVENQGKLLDHLTALLSRRPEHVVGLFHDDLLVSGVDRAFVKAAQNRNIVPEVLSYHDLDEFRAAVNASRTRTEAFFIPVSDGLILQLAEAASIVNSTGIPAAYSRRDQVRAGGLVATAAPVEEIYQQLARYSVLVMHGANASKLDITQPTRLETTVNLKTANQIGKLVPFELLVEAHQIRE